MHTYMSHHMQCTQNEKQQGTIWHFFGQLFDRKSLPPFNFLFGALVWLLLFSLQSGLFKNNLSSDSVTSSILAHPWFTDECWETIRCQTVNFYFTVIYFWLFTLLSIAIFSLCVQSTRVLAFLSAQFYIPWVLTGLIFFQSRELSVAISKTTTQRHWFFRTQASLWSNTWRHRSPPGKP